MDENKREKKKEKKKANLGIRANNSTCKHNLFFISGRTEQLHGRTDRRGRVDARVDKQNGRGYDCGLYIGGGWDGGENVADLNGSDDVGLLCVRGGCGGSVEKMETRGYTHLLLDQSVEVSLRNLRASE